MREARILSMPRANTSSWRCSVRHGLSINEDPEETYAPALKFRPDSAAGWSSAVTAWES